VINNSPKEKEKEREKKKLKSKTTGLEDRENPVLPQPKLVK